MHYRRKCNSYIFPINKIIIALLEYKKMDVNLYRDKREHSENPITQKRH